MKKSVVFIFICLFLLQGVIAETEITVHAQPLTGLVIRVQDANSGAQIESLYGKTDIKGNATVIYTGNRAEISMTIHLVKDGNVADTKEFGPFSTNSPIYVSFIKEEPKNETQEITKNETNITIAVNSTTSNEENTKLSGAAVTESNNFNIPRWIYYTIGGILGLGILIFLVFRFKDSFNFGGAKSVHELEGELKHFQQEIQRIKSVQHAEKQIEKDKEELRRLRKS